MPKYRKLHVKAVDSIDINDMPDDFTRLLWVLLPLGLDSAGRGIDNASWIKARVMPLRDDITPERIEIALTWYAEHGMIRRYSVKGRCYIDIPTWKLYQGDTTRESPSHLPPYEAKEKKEEAEKINSRVTHELVMSNSTLAESTCESTCESVFNAQAVESFHDHTAQRAVRLYRAVTGQNDIPSGVYEKALIDLTSVLDYFNGHDPPAEEGQRIFARWCATRGKSGRYYNKLNPGWITWWLEELAPVPVDMTVPDINKDPAAYAAYLAEKYKDEP